MSEKIDEFNRLGVICRICLKGDGPMSSIFAKNDPGNRNEAILATKITSIAQVEVSTLTTVFLTSQNCCGRVQSKQQKTFARGKKCC